MATVTQILVGLDLDAAGRVTLGGRAAAERGWSLAEKTGATLSFLHSSPTPPSGERLEALEKWVQATATDGPAPKLLFPEAPPAEAIVQQAAQGRADLVIVGKHDRDDPLHRRLGGVARTLVRNCPVPVWAADAAHWRIRRILATTNLGPVGQRAVVSAARLAALYGAELHVVHIYTTPMELQFLSESEGRERVRSIRENAHDAIEEAVASAEVDVTARIHLGCTTPDRGIRSVVTEREIDLLIMGSLSREGLPGLLIGNTAARLLDRVECSLLAIKPDDFRSPFLPSE